MGDEFILMPIYSAGEKDEFGVSLDQLLKKIGHKNGRIIQNIDELYKKLLAENKNRVFLFMGAGSISSIAHGFSEKIEQLRNN